MMKDKAVTKTTFKRFLRTCLCFPIKAQLAFKSKSVSIHARTLYALN